MEKRVRVSSNRIKGKKKREREERSNGSETTSAFTSSGGEPSSLNESAFYSSYKANRSRLSFKSIKAIKDRVYRGTSDLHLRYNFTG